MRKLMSISDLHEFYKSQGKSIKFSSMESKSPIVVHVTEPFSFSSSEDNELYLKTNLRFCHTERNVNESYISKETMEEALPTVYNMPILGYIWDDNGTPRFAGHEMYEDEKGDIVYEEIPIGIVPESSPLSFNENKNGKTYLEGTGLIWKTYSKAADILQREKKLSVSVELLVDDLTYDEEEDVLILNKIRFTGVTILEEDPTTGDEILPGMQGAEISIEDFSMKNSIFNKKELKDVIKETVMQALNDINTQRKEENNQMNHFEELLQKYGKTVEEVTFAYEGLSDEELDAAFAEAFEKAPEPEITDDASTEPTVEEKTVTMSVTIGETVRTFARSLGDVIYALSDLVNATYSDDQTYYGVEVFDDGSAKSKYLIMVDVYGGKAYKQSWSFKDGVYALKGERVEVYSIWVTAEERDELESMRSNYSAINTKLEEAEKELDLYKAEPEKIEMLSSDDYASIKETTEFAELSKRENYFSLSKEDLEQKLNDMLVNFAKQYGKEKASETPTDDTVGVKRFGIGRISSKNSRYGGIFDKNTDEN